jgi:hypothetical protein
MRLMRLPLTPYLENLFRLSLSLKEIHKEMKVFFAFRKAKSSALYPSKSGLMNKHIVKPD